MLRQFTIMLMLFTAGVLPLLSQSTSDGDHIVSNRDLQQAVRASAQARQDNLAKIDQFFSSEPATKAFASVKLDPARISRAVNFLGDDELARLIQRSQPCRNSHCDRSWRLRGTKPASRVHTRPVESYTQVAYAVPSHPTA